MMIFVGQNLIELELKNAWLAVQNMNVMPMLTSLTLELIRLDDKNLTELNTCFPNLQVLNLIDVRGGNSKFNLEVLFCTFPNITSLCFKPRVWSEFEVWCGDIGLKGVKRFCGYLSVIDPLMTFTLVDCMLEECFNCVEISLLIHRGVPSNVSKHFITKCMAQWPDLKWGWGIWEEGREDSWIPEEQLPKTLVEEGSDSI
uniref:FBD domain-containing protein n=1 Tax=Lactuca sativa TaxID=4236 RepID=A0A9R1X387_LACSA|nr:hypothetical protein LSAT_V11C700358020 [Lactuca sativa]